VNADVSATAAIALSKLASGTSGQIIVANVSGVPTYVTASGDVLNDNAGVLTIQANSVALGTDTTGNYVSSATASGGLTLTGTEGASLGILLPAATDALSATTSSGSGLELLSGGLAMLQGCSDGQILKWNETTDVWACAADSTGGSPALSSILAATGTNSINNGNHAQTWNWQLTGSTNGMNFTENAASTGTGYITSIGTLASSTAKPFSLLARGNTIFDTTATGGLTLGNTTANTPITLQSGTGAIDIGTDANAKTVTIGNATTTTAVNITTGTSGADITSTANTGTALTVTANSLSTGNGLSLTSTGVITSGGELAEMIANSATTGNVVNISGTALTSGAALAVTGGGANMLTAGEVVDVNTGANTVGAGVRITSTGTYTGTGATDGILNITANSATTGNVGYISATGLTSGSALTIVGSTPLTTGGELINIDMGAATAGNGLSATTTGAYTGTGLLSLTANSATTGTAASISTTGLTTGNSLLVTTGFAVNNAGTGNGINLALSTPADTTGTNTHQGINITPTVGNATGGTNVLNLLNIANITGDAEVSINALNIGNLTGTTAAEDALVIGTGWDSELELFDTTPNIQLAATDNTAAFSIIDNCTTGCANGGTTPNKLLTLRDYATNFGGLLESGGYFGYNSYFSEEFNVDTSSAITADSAVIGDSGAMYFDTTSTTQTYTALDGVGGFGRLTSGTTSGVGGLIGFGNAQNNLSLIFLKANLPVLQMKVRTNINNATNDIFWGFMDLAAAPTLNDTKPTNGMYFWNNNAAGSWQGVVRSGGADVGTVTCTGTISTTQFAVGRIQVESSTSVRFLMDYDASDGIDFTDCGTVSGANPTAALGVAIYNVHTEITGGRTVDIDYARAWQDDPNAPATPEVTPSLVDAAAGTPAAGTAIPEERLTQYLNDGQLVTGMQLIEAVKTEARKDIFALITEKIQSNAEFITDYISARVIAVRGYFDQVFARTIETEEICVRNAAGEKTCLTKEQLDTVISNAARQGQSTAAPSEGGSSEGSGAATGGTPAGDTTAPVVTPNGGDEGTHNQTVSIGTSWIDLGAVATDDVGVVGDIVATYTDATGTTVSSVDTSTIGTYTVTYTAHDAAGNTGTATRTVQIVQQ
jgi:hypothetical protein